MLASICKLVRPVYRNNRLQCTPRRNTGSHECAVVREKLRISKNQSNSVEVLPLQRIVSHVAALFICFRACLITSLVLSQSISVLVACFFSNSILQCLKTWRTEIQRESPEKQAGVPRQQLQQARIEGGVPVIKVAKRQVRTAIVSAYVLFSRLHVRREKVAYVIY